MNRRSPRSHPAAFLGAALTLLLVPAAFGQAPVVVTAPRSQAVPEGGSAWLRVETAGALPVTYTWRRNFEFTNYCQVTLDSHECTLVLTNLTPAKACFFNLQVGNAQGYAPGKQVIVAVTSAGMETNGFALSIRGLTNSLWRIECNTNLATDAWTTLTNFSIPRSPPVFKFVDLEGTNLSRFYRVIPKVY